MLQIFKHLEDKENSLVPQKGTHRCTEVIKAHGHGVHKREVLQALWGHRDVGGHPVPALVQHSSLCVVMAELDWLVLALLWSAKHRDLHTRRGL